MIIQRYTHTGRLAKGSISEADKSPAQPGTYTVVGAYQGNKVQFDVGQYNVKMTKEELEHLLKYWTDK